MKTQNGDTKMGLPMFMPGFRFSMPAYDLINGSSTSVLWNQLFWKSAANSVMYQFPMAQGQITQYPAMGFPDPVSAVQASINRFKSGAWLNDLGGGASAAGYGGYLGNIIGNNQSSNSSNSSKKEETAEDIEAKEELQLLTSVVNDFINKKEKAKEDRSIVAKLKAALKKNGTPKEKLTSLKNAVGDIDSNEFKEFILASEYKSTLVQGGYRFTVEDDDTEMKDNINNLSHYIRNHTEAVLSTITSLSNINVLRLVSYWNAQHPTASDRGIIRFVANELSKDDDKKKNVRNGLGHMVLALENQINKIQRLDRTIDVSTMNAQKEALEKAWEAANKEDANHKPVGFTKTNLLKVADAFDALYASLRLAYAAYVDKKADNTYEFVPNYEKNTVVRDTKEALKAEGIDITKLPTTTGAAGGAGNASNAGGASGADNAGGTGETSDAGESGGAGNAGGTGAEETLDTVLTGPECGLKKSVRMNGVYFLKDTKTGQNRFFYNNNSKLIELLNVKGMANGYKSFIMKDGTTKTIQQLIDDNSFLDVETSYVKELKETNDLITELIDSGRLKVLPDVKYRNGVTVYKSAFMNDGNYEFYVVNGSKLQKLPGVLDDTTEKITLPDGTKLRWNELTEGNYTDVTKNNIPEKDSQAAEDGRELGIQTAGYKTGNWRYDWRKMQANIRKVNKDNVIDFILGYNSQSNNKFFHSIAAMRHNMHSGAITCDDMAIVLKAIIDKYNPIKSTLSEKQKEALNKIKDHYSAAKEIGTKAYAEGSFKGSFSWLWEVTKSLVNMNFIDEIDDAVLVLAGNTEEESEKEDKEKAE